MKSTLIIILMMIKLCNPYSKKLIPNKKLSCLYQMYKIHREPHTLIIYNENKDVSDVLPLNFPKTVFNLKKGLENLSSYGKVNLYVLMIGNLTDLETIYKTLYDFQIWNARAKFIVSFTEDEDLNTVFDLSWKYFVTNIIVINFTEENIYSYFPYGGEKCGNNITSQLLSKCSEATLENIYPNKIPLNLNGCKIRVAIVIIEPLVINLTAKITKPHKAGLEVVIFHTIATKLNFSSVYLEFPNEFWGERLENRTYTELYGRLQKREVDILYGYFNRYAEYDLDFDTTFPHLTDVSNFWVPVPSKRPEWENIIRIFHIYLWMLIIGTIFINAIVWRLIASRNEKEFFKRFTNCLFTSWYVLLQNSLSSPKSTPLRIAYYTWCITCVIIYAGYTSNLINFLTNPLYEKQIDTLEDLLQSRLNIGLDTYSMLSFNSSDPLEKLILDKTHLCDDYNKCLYQMAIEKSMSLFSNRRSVEYQVQRRFSSLHGQALISEICDYGFLDVISFSVAKGFPLISRMNDIIMKMLENGLIHKWITDLTVRPAKKPHSSKKIPLSLQHVQTAFYILACGYFAAFCTVFTEILLKYCLFRDIDNKNK